MTRVITAFIEESPVTLVVQAHWSPGEKESLSVPDEWEIDSIEALCYETGNDITSQLNLETMEQVARENIEWPVRPHR